MSTKITQIIWTVLQAKSRSDGEHKQMYELLGAPVAERGV